MPDILYVLLPIGGAFTLVFLVCFCRTRLKETFHYPKHLVEYNTSVQQRRQNNTDDTDEEHYPKYTIRIKKKKRKKTIWEKIFGKRSKFQPVLSSSDDHGFSEATPHCSYISQQQMVISPV